MPLDELGEYDQPAQAEVAVCMGLSKNMIERYVMRAIEHVQERLRAHHP